MPTEHTRIAEQPEAGPGTPTVTEFAVTGMTCGNCARHVTEALQSVPGVRSAEVDLEASRARVRWNSGRKENVDAALKAVEAEGYGARVIDADTATHGHEPGEHSLSGWRINLFLGLPVTLFLMAGEWALGLGTRPWFQWLSFVLVSFVQVFAGARFYRGAWGQLKVGSSNMDTLVALGSTTAFAYSTWALFHGHTGHVYFMEAAAIITLISVGHWMESRVSVRASSALRKLLNLAPASARLLLPGGQEEEVPVASLRAGAQVVLRPGDRIPTDGEVVEGESAVDESMLTGESAPVNKTTGSQLYAGTVNENGRLLMRVTATGEETALAHIVAAVRRAQNSRANIQRLGDRVSSIFVPVVVCIALAAALWWGLAPESATLVHNWVGRFIWFAQPPEGPVAAAFIIAAAVLIIACPCAMGLATPAAIMAGSNVAAQRGILIRDGVALEKAGEVNAIVFDKTGTLTVGKPAVVKIWEPGVSSSGGNGKPAQRAANGGLPFPQLAAALARHSSHPISRAVAKIASADNIGLSAWEEFRGSGVQARLTADRNSHSGTELVRLGSPRWLRENGTDLAQAAAFMDEWSAQGATLVGVSADGALLGMLAIKDTVKTGAAKVVGQLQRQGMETYLVTGDNPLTAAALAVQAGIPKENVFAEVKPQQKAEFVKGLQAKGQRVAFVGDGINDAPALEQSDLGIAVSRASDIAREAADIILLKSEIEAVPESVGLARATLRTIKQNLFWAFFYNAVGIPLAALGFMSPILCAAAMGLSDLVVLGNALRLRGWHLRDN